MEVMLAEEGPAGRSTTGILATSRPAGKVAILAEGPGAGAGADAAGAAGAAVSEVAAAGGGT